MHPTGDTLRLVFSYRAGGRVMPAGSSLLQSVPRVATVAENDRCCYVSGDLIGHHLEMQQQRFGSMLFKPADILVQQIDFKCVLPHTFRCFDVYC